MKLKDGKELNRIETYLLWLFTDETFSTRVGIIYDSENYEDVKKAMNKELAINPNYKDRLRIEKRTMLWNLVEEVE